MIAGHIFFSSFKPSISDSGDVDRDRVRSRTLDESESLECGEGLLVGLADCPRGGSVIAGGERIGELSEMMLRSSSSSGGKVLILSESNMTSCIMGEMDLGEMGVVGGKSPALE